MKHFLLFYDLAPDYLERRGQLREAHLRKAWAACAAGDMVLGGALADPPDMAVVLFKGESPRAAEEFARSDPYVLNGLVVGWRVREWSAVVGDAAINPVRP